jgi:ABC-type lipoprotein export system ATPase subunit
LELLRLHDVHKQFQSPGDGGDLAVLSGIDLVLSVSESIAIAGPSGSGKSTLLNIMGALDQPTSGQVVLDGRVLGGCSDTALSKIRIRDIGFIFQLHHLLPQCTVLENVLLPTIPAGTSRKPATLQYARELLQRVNLGHRLSHLPGQLSGGECQRAALVRALINRPRLLLADEPTGSLDKKSALALGDLLVDLNRDGELALVVVTHSWELARRMSRVYRLEEGRLHRRGEHDFHGKNGLGGEPADIGSGSS